MTFPRPVTGAPVTLVLGRGIEMDCSFPSLDSVEVSIRWWRRRLFHHRFDADNRVKEHPINLGIVRFVIGVETDMFRGQIVWRFDVAGRLHPGRGWRRLTAGADRVLVSFDPCLGELASSTAVWPPQVDDSSFGQSQLCTPSILRIHVEDRHRDLCRVGRAVKAEMFPDHQPFVFNTVACVGAFGAGGPGLYPDPASIWFNVFLGYYQLDCLKSSWSRPFGYQEARGRASTPEPEDLVRLGKSDWNWFSNWNYGVPTEALVPYSRVDMSRTGFTHRGLVQIGRSHWHEVELTGVEVASCYVSDPAELVSNTVIDSVWRAGFGGPRPRPSWPTSFVSTAVGAAVDMAYWEDDDAYHTVLFGGTAVQGSNPAFLSAQLAATRAVIAQRYPDLGFA